MKLASRVLCVVALTWTVLLVLGFALEHSRTVDYSPINGRFQDFDPVRRLAAGQWIGRDFDVYLGIGPTYALRAAMFVFGDSFRASLFASHLLSAGSYALTLFVLARLCGARWLGAVLLAASATSLALGDVPEWVPASLRVAHGDFVDALFTPGNSSQYLRAAAPLAAVLAYLGARRVLARERVLAWLARRGVGPLGARALACGAVSGAALIWSNDYGPPTAAAFFCGAVFADAELRGQRRAFFFRAAPAACASAVLILALATGGAPGEWLAYNLRGVAADQRWAFYLRVVEESASAALDVWLLAGVAIVFVFAVRSATGRARAGEPWLLVFTGATLAAAFLTTRASAQTRYALPLVRVLLVAAPYLTFVALDALWLRLGSAHTRESARRLLGAAGVVLATFVLVAQTPLHAARLWPVSDRALLADSEALRIDVAELGGPAAASLDKLVALGQRIRAEAERAGVPREKRLFATYATGLTVVADALQPTRTDYIIHALGAERRAGYVADFVAAEPLYVATQRGPYADWELWARKHYWEFYRELYRNYDACDSSLEHLLWRRRDTPRAPASFDVHCTPGAAGDEPAAVAISIEPANDRATGDVWVVDLELEFDAYPGHAPDALARLQDGVLAIDRGVIGLERVVAVRADAGHLAIPVDVVVGAPASVVLRSVPAGRAPPRITGARARALAPRHELERVVRTQLVAAEHSDANWLHGVSCAGGAAGFFVRDSFDLAELAPGMRLRFAGAGAHTVLRVEGPQVWVDGAPLEPRADGFPNWIEILR